jgi:serine/threonine protein kinase
MPISTDGETHLSPGYRLDRYELLCPIGAGGMASVWVARLQGKHGFEKLVAIKTILPRYARDPAFQQMFLDEARIAARIQHINVAQILDLGDHHGVLFLVMEWVDGDALSKLAHAVTERGAVFPAGIAGRMLADVCAGLHAAHELHDRSGGHLEVVHRDVSPHNILLDRQGVAKVIDFGIAKARDRAAGDTKTGSFKGKVKYMAPEQAVAPKSTDRRADIWAVGAVLYSLLAGRSPYESDNDMATLVQLAQQKPPPPLPSEVPEPIRRVVSRALAWEPNDRYATAAELRDALEGAMAAAGTVTTSADVAAFGALYLTDRMDQRQRAIAIALNAAEERVRVERLLTPEDTGDRRILRPSEPTIPEQGGAVRPSDHPPEAHRNQSETSPTLGTAASMTFNLPGARRRTGIAAAAGVLALVGGTLALFHRGEPSPNGSRTASAVAPASAPPSVAPSPAPEPHTAPEPPGTATPPLPRPQASVAASSATPAPVSGRRPPSPRKPEPSAPARAAASPAPSATAKHRAEYGF